MRRLAAILALLLLPTACGAPARGPGVEPLLDGDHAPLLLTESRRIEVPPSYSGNRFLRGWGLWRRRGEIWLVPRPEGAVLEIVHLAPRSRRLILNTEIFKASPDARVGVRISGSPRVEIPLTSPLELALPAELPPGRVPVTLYFPPGAEVALDAGGFEEALPAGEIAYSGDDILQSPTSILDLPRAVSRNTRLRGRFRPPERSRPGLRFAVLVERDGEEPRTVFEWRHSWWNRLRGERGFSADLAGGGFSRVRLLAAGGGGAGRWSELRLEPIGPASEIPGAQVPEPPRLVLVYVLDALRADAVGHLGGGPESTPTLDRLAAEGVTLTGHRSVAPNTLPSTKSLFTGQAFVTRGHAKLPDPGPETLAEVFASAGFRTAAFSGNGYISETYGTARGFEHASGGSLFREYRDRPGAYNDNAERVHRNALAWLDGLAEGERAFLYLHTIHPHNPYDPPEPFLSRFTAGIDSSIDASTDTLLGIKHHRVEVSGADRNRVVGLYRGGLAYNDAQIALLLEELKRRLPPREILLVVTSDHGEELFDHGGVLHGYTLFREQLHIPLMLWWPGVLTPARLDLPTDNLDLHETLRRLVRAPASGAGDGRPFWRHLLDTRSPDGTSEIRFAAAASVKGGIFMARSQRYKLVLAPRTGLDWGMGEGRGRSREPEYLFDLANDPGEMENLAGQSSIEVDWLRSRLEAWVERGKLREADAEDPVLDSETEERLRALGYLQ